MSTRINKYLADLGYCSRRDADKLIFTKKVHVNGKVAKLGDKVEDGDDVVVIGKSRKGMSSKKIYLALNKPLGFITTMDRNKENNVSSLVHTKGRVFPIGRLDVASSGLLLMTNDGELANKLMHPKFEHDKEYDVVVDHPLSERDLKILREGVGLGDGRTLPTKVRKQSAKRFRIVLREGKNRQIRRMCEVLGYKITRLKRVRIANIKLGSLKPGTWRELTKPEIEGLKT
jgi:23S rRNA pseudouridine2604 synthase